MNRRGIWLAAGSAVLLVLLQGACRGRAAEPKFDADRAFSLLKKQVAFGPRYPGSRGHLRTRNFLFAELKKYTGRVRLQPFLAVNYLENRRARAFNLIAEFGKGTPEIILCAHWDSRPKADQDPDPANRSKPVPAANDGASGVAVLLELARMFHETPPPVPVQIVFFDAEDLGRAAHDEEFLQGSRFYAKNLPFRFRPRAAILLDMIGDRDLQIYEERNSLNYAPDLVEAVWTKAEELGIKEFIRAPKYTVTDDHLPLLQAGIPAIDLIDFDYPYWHTVADTPDKCSPESLEKVGRVLAAFVYGSSR